MLYPTLHQKSSEKFLGAAVGSVGKTTSDFLFVSRRNFFLSSRRFWVSVMRSVGHWQLRGQNCLYCRKGLWRESRGRHRRAFR